MPHIKDEGSEFDAPIDTVWKFVMSEDHGPAHKSSRNPQVKPVADNVMLITQEQNFNGNWVKTTNRITQLPPTGFVVEVIEGPLAGSKFINYYTPKGDRTEVTVVGDFTSKAIPENQIEPAVRGYLATVFEEDSIAIREMSNEG
jgi:hypothetical protein